MAAPHGMNLETLHAIIQNERKKRKRMKKSLKTLQSPVGPTKSIVKASQSEEKPKKEPTQKQLESREKNAIALRAKADEARRWRAEHPGYSWNAAVAAAHGKDPDESQLKTENKIRIRKAAKAAEKAAKKAGGQVGGKTPRKHPKTEMFIPSTDDSESSSESDSDSGLEL